MLSHLVITPMDFYSQEIEDSLAGIARFISKLSVDSWECILIEENILHFADNLI